MPGFKAQSFVACPRRAPRQGVPRRVPSLTLQVDSFAADAGGDRPIHRWDVPPGAD